MHQIDKTVKCFGAVLLDIVALFSNYTFLYCVMYDVSFWFVWQSNFSRLLIIIFVYIVHFVYCINYIVTNIARI